MITNGNSLIDTIFLYFNCLSLTLRYVIIVNCQSESLLSIVIL